MFLSMGNIAVTAKIGMLFIDFEPPHRLRMQGTASLVREGPVLAGYPGANIVASVTVDHVWMNCPRYIHPMRAISTSPHIPDTSGYATPALWKRIDVMQDILSAADAAAAREAGLITEQDYAALLAEGAVDGDG
jgi:hypothetical protein|tara:strand:+ start:4024 stop:4425 length:402 start_codon:yes stop_codon:yes gene_type:complete